MCSPRLVVGAASLVAGYIGAFIVGVYLFVTDWFHLHPDIVFAVQGRTEFKSFIRLHIDHRATSTSSPSESPVAPDVAQERDRGRRSRG